MTRRFAALVLALMLLYGGLVAPQVPGTPEEQMTVFQSMEEDLLRNRDELLAREEALGEPIWVYGSEGGVDVIDGMALLDRASVAIELALAVGLDEALPSWLPDEARRVAELALEGRAENLESRLLEAYRAHSRAVRAAELMAIEQRLEMVREAFALAMALRDDAQGEDWLTAIAARGAELPAGVTLVDPEPSMDRECPSRPGYPAAAPIWILVADASACADPWKARGGSGSYEGTSGEWCVWCPAGMYWRSGWGCCVPNP